MNWKQNLAVVLATIMLLGCPEPKEEESVVQKPIELPDGKTGCACTGTKHLGIGEICPCGADNCACELKVYGTITDNAGNVIPIYRKGNVPEKTMNGAVKAYTTAYKSLSPARKEGLVGRITELFVSDATDRSYWYTHKGDGFSLGFAIWALGDIKMGLEFIGDGTLIPRPEGYYSFQKARGQFLVNLCNVLRKKHRIA